MGALSLSAAPAMALHHFLAHPLFLQRDGDFRAPVCRILDRTGIGPAEFPGAAPGFLPFPWASVGALPRRPPAPRKVPEQVVTAAPPGVCWPPPAAQHLSTAGKMWPCLLRSPCLHKAHHCREQLTRHRRRLLRMNRGADHNRGLNCKVCLFHVQHRDLQRVSWRGGNLTVGNPAPACYPAMPHSQQGLRKAVTITPRSRSWK